MIYKYIVAQCAPTLAGLKVANLFSYNFDSNDNVEYQIKKMNRLFNPKGVYFKVLRCEGKQALLYVYRKRQLAELLANADIKEFLHECDYEDYSIDACLEKLEIHLKNKDFPHEIGIFLGYPLADIRAFILHKGMNYKCVGCWKVYTDECNAQKVFAKFKKCKDIYCKKYAEGFDIFRLTVAS